MALDIFFPIKDKQGVTKLRWDLAKKPFQTMSNSFVNWSSLIFTQTFFFEAVDNYLSMINVSF